MHVRVPPPQAGGENLLDRRQMTSTQRLGLGLLSPSEKTGVVERAVWAEQHGYDSVWIPDGGGKMHALTLAAAVAARTSTIRVGTGIVPVYTHTPAVLASAAITVADLAPGRFIMGLGASSHAMIEGWHGLRFEKPLTRVRETALVLRRMLAGEKVEFAGETLSTRGFRLNPAPAQPVPIHIAALRPKMLELAGEVADGVILHLCPKEVLPRMLEHVEAGAKRAGRSLADIEVLCRLNVYVTSDLAAGRDFFRRTMVGYYSTPVYNKFLAWVGYEEEAETIAAGFREGDRDKTISALSDEAVERLAVIGDAEKCRAEVQGFMEAGIQTPIINPIATDPAEAELAMEAFASA
jgi:probable F420-dependent oxidoreductase